MTSMLIDTHCHLDAAEYDADRDAVAARAQHAGVGCIVVPSVAAFNLQSTVECRHYAGVEIALGLHAMYVHEHGGHRPTLPWLRYSDCPGPGRRRPQSQPADCGIPR